MKLTRILLASLLIITLAACGTDSEKGKKDDTADQPKKAEQSTPICPQVAILRDIDTYKDYGREKPDPSQLVAEAKMVGVTGDCAYEDNGVDITFDLNFVAAKGPRLGGLHTTFPYFVAVVDPQQNILNKEELTAEIGFSSDSKIQDHAESLHIFIPLAKDQRISGPFYQVLMGFQMSPDQLDAIIKRAKKPD